MRVKFLDTTDLPDGANDCIELELDCVPRVGESVTIDYQISENNWFRGLCRTVCFVSWSINNHRSVAVVHLGEP